MIRLSRFVAWAIVLAVAGPSHALSARLETGKSNMIAGEYADLQLLLVNDGPDAVKIDMQRVSCTSVEISTGSDWWDCYRPGFGCPGVPTPDWRSLKPGESVSIGFGLMSCAADRPPNRWTSPSIVWTGKPGKYRLRAQIGQAPAVSYGQDVPYSPERNWDGPLTTNELAFDVREPLGLDAEAFAWAAAHGKEPMSIEAVNQFPASRYAAMFAWPYLGSLDKIEPEEIERLIRIGHYPRWVGIPDASSPDGRRNLNERWDTAMWVIETGERILREQRDFPYMRGVQLCVAVNYAVVGNDRVAKRQLRALAGEGSTPEAKWAARFLDLHKWSGTRP